MDAHSCTLQSTAPDACVEKGGFQIESGFVQLLFCKKLPKLAIFEVKIDHLQPYHS